MKTIKTFLFTASLIMLGQTAHAQFLERLQKKVERTVERVITNKTEKKAEEATNGAIDGILGTNSSDHNDDFYNDDKPIASKTYTFNKVLIYDVRNESKSADDTFFMELHYLYNTSNPNILGMEMSMKGKEKTSYVVTTEGASMLITDNGKTKPIRISKDLIKSVDFDKILGETKITKTGRTQTILGYICDEFIHETKYGTSTMWVSRKPVINTALTNLISSKKQKEIFGDGVVLKSVYKTDDGVMYMDAKQIKNKKTKIKI